MTNASSVDVEAQEQAVYDAVQQTEIHSFDQGNFGQVAVGFVIASRQMA